MVEQCHCNYYLANPAYGKYRLIYFHTEFIPLANLCYGLYQSGAYADHDDGDEHDLLI